MPRLQRWVHRWQQLAPWERRILLRLLWRLPLLKWRLARVAEPAQLLRAQQVGVQQTWELPLACTQADFAVRCARLVALVARQPGYAATCLPQALVLLTLLQEHGVPSRLRLGVTRATDTAITAHAWVEHDGVALGSAVEHYTPFADLAPARRPALAEHSRP